ITADRAAEKPIATLSSAPAAGAIAAAKIGAQAGLVHIVTFDGGGASTDVSLLPGREPYGNHPKQVERGLPTVAAVRPRGAGGMVAGAVARELDIPRVLIPIYPGNTCAMGLLMTDMREDASVAFLARANQIDLDALNERLGELDARVRGTLGAQGIPADRI